MAWGAKAAIVAFAFLGIGSIVYFLYRREERNEEEDYISFGGANRKVLEIKVPKDCLPLIIGRGGCKIKEVESATQTKINFRDIAGSTEHSLCVVRGTDDAVLLAEHMIHETIVNQPLIENFEMYVPIQACGRIIGKNGENIRHISRSSNAKIIVENDKLSRDKSECRIIIKGTTEQIQYAKLLVEQKVEEDNTFRNMVKAGAANRSPRHRAKYMLTGPEEADAKETVSHKESLVATGSDGLLEVYVSAISDPEKFWVQMMGPSTVALDRLNEQMTDYYSKEENRLLHVLKEVEVDQIVAAPFYNDNKWYRAEVSDIKPDEYDPEESELNLYYVDYGDSALCKKKDVYELRTDFLRLRFQAIECILAKIKPRGTWSEEAIDLFETLTYTGLWRPMTARVHGYRERPTRAKREGSPVPCVELYDSQGAATINIAEEMVRNGFAEWAEEEEDARKK
ncbi:UNVERIFIED_CONTAM: hypothetical protein PYX00_003167 [Menopon gallinae]|uniref:Tudor domain-containing protein n=1 Tax=Menopon gallinae TaxID=328185 RepID=A0AAW2I0W0_9NEOP